MPTSMRQMLAGTFFGFAFCSGTYTQASGTYPITIPRPLTAGENLNEETYARGRSIFLGKYEFTHTAAADAVVESARRLASLQVQLPESLQAETNLPGLATRLDPSELAALEYYLEKRYKIVPKTEAHSS